MQLQQVDLDKPASAVVQAIKTDITKVSTENLVKFAAGAKIVAEQVEKLKEPIKQELLKRAQEAETYGDKDQHLRFTFGRCQVSVQSVSASMRADEQKAIALLKKKNLYPLATLVTVTATGHHGAALIDSVVNGKKLAKNSKEACTIVESLDHEAFAAMVQTTQITLAEFEACLMESKKASYSITPKLIESKE